MIAPNSTVSPTTQASVTIIIGDPVAHSLSPLIHNTGYRANGLPFVMVAANVTAEDLPDAIRGMHALGFKGISVTMPHKAAILPFLDGLDSTATEIGAVNTVVNESGKLIGYNTDWLGILRPLERAASLRGKRVAVLGAGGAAQAAVFATTRRGCEVTVFNRTLDKALDLARRWGCRAEPLEGIELVGSYDIIINCTSIGMGSQSADCPIPADVLAKHHIVFETIYSPYTTRLIAAAEEKNATTIRGSEMFLEQALAQFELHTGATAPRDDMERALRKAIEG